jgi:ATP-binding cassette subfamily B protein
LRTSFVYTVFVPGLYFYVRSRLRKFAGELSYLPHTLELVWAAAGPWTVLWLALLVLQGLLPVALVYLTRSVVNVLLPAVRAGGSWAALRPALPLAIAFGGTLLAIEVLRNIGAYGRAAQAELVEEYINGLVQRKSLEADLGFYESAEFYDRLHRARTEASFRPAMLVDNLGSLLQNGITLVAMTAVLLMFGPWLPIALLLCTVPALVVVLLSSRRQHEFSHRGTPIQRKTWYYERLVTEGESAAEIRLFSLGGYFCTVLAELRHSLRRDRLALARKRALGDLLAGVLALAVSAAVIAWMVLQALRGIISFGNLALFYQALNQGLGLARSLLNNIGQLYENVLFLSNLFEFLTLEPQIVSPSAPIPIDTVRDGIRFENVTFRYPGTERSALRNFDLAIPVGHTVAVVGPNGAGKSTLAKLLCRFYDPEDGSIRIDGVPLTQFSVEELRSRISVLFQTPIHFSTTVFDNIRYGALGNSDHGDIRRAAGNAGADEVIARLPHGFMTHLGKHFAQGTELSTGEWQRIALARTLFRPAPIVLLDEPTSAMDPWTEIRWAQAFRRMTHGRIVILITHRFTTAMFADVIHVMSEGRIVESGTHPQLLAAGGLYARGWALDAAGTQA